MSPRPDLSVVVAAWLDADGLSQCLEALRKQADETCEIIVAASFPQPDREASAAGVQWMDEGPDLLIPQLWSRGISKSTGSVVALTTSHFLPDRTWIETIRSGHLRLDSFGIGGPVDPPRGGSSIDWATFFLRYSNYLHLEGEQTVHEIAGDNASYKRSALDAHGEVIRDGFWEPEFHRAAHATGGSLTFTSAMRVTQQRSFPLRVFLGQRFSHGRQFGFDRVAGRGAPIRFARVATAPLVPFVLLGKIVIRVLRSRRDLGPFLAALPVLTLFIVAWSTGEAWGYLSRSGVAHNTGLRD